MRRRVYATNAERQQAYRDRVNRNADRNTRRQYATNAERQQAYRARASLQKDAIRLMPHIQAIDPRWSLSISRDRRELELIGIEPPAAWRSAAACEDWIRRQEEYSHASEG